MKWLDTPVWVPIDIPASKLPQGEQKLRQALEELAVEKSPRYKARGGLTYCNVFATDVLRAMGAPPAHWVKPDGSEAPVGKGRELNANGIVRWMKTHGPKYHWTQADRQSATDAAARGHLVLVGWDSGSNKPGHVAIMLPEGTIAQAGKRNFVGETISQGFGNLPVEFFVYMRGSHEST